ncbi:MAG TPA: DNA-formamidopyrimidine glycosylase family protein [Candidatus Acidoferrum sp.]|nr:DNA-formamidopyrimidine glycosylase family protein [Candidatus Acidoferrum sp.]
MRLAFGVMPELAEVEFYRKQWDAGRKQRIVSLHLHGGKRIFRGMNAEALRQALTGARLLESHAHGKQMLFRFSKNAWVGIHLGMTGKLRAVPSRPAPFLPARHDHLVLRLSKRSLVFSDPRQFGRVLFHTGRDAPGWWKRLPPALLGGGFTLALMEEFLSRHRAAPVKAVLLLQAGFPGIGNWMADEILWQAGLHPLRPAGRLRPEEIRKLRRTVKSVARTALRTVGADYGDLPRRWLFDRRWKRGERCPKDGAPLRHAAIGGRTTCWCPKCQKEDCRANVADMGGERAYSKDRKKS